MLDIIKKLSDFFRNCSLPDDGLLRPENVGVDTLQQCCNSKELCADVGLYCNNFVIIHGM